MKNEIVNHRSHAYYWDGSALHPLQSDFCCQDQTWLVLTGLKVRAFVFPLPPISKAKQLQAARYALEDETLSVSPDAHITLSDRDEDGNVGVYLIQGEDYASVREAIREKGLVIEGAVPDYLMLPCEQGKVTVRFLQGSVLFRTSLRQGGAVPVRHAALLMETIAQENPAKAIWVFSADKAQQRMCAAVCTALGCDVVFDPPCLPGHIVPPVNCLARQDQAKRAGSHRHYRRAMVGCIISVCLCLGSALVVPSLAASYDKKRSRAMDAMIHLVASRWGVSYDDPVALQAYLTRALAQAKSYGQQDALLPMLSSLQTVLKTEHQVYLQQLDYTGGHLSLAVAINKTNRVHPPSGLSSLLGAFSRVGLRVLAQTAHEDQKRVFVQLTLGRAT